MPMVVDTWPTPRSHASGVAWGALETSRLSIAGLLGITDRIAPDPRPIATPNRQQRLRPVQSSGALRSLSMLAEQ